MKRLHPQLSAAQWEAALRESERIWPEPALAPEVPPETELVKYLEGGPRDFRPEWLREQIEESAACQRALEDLRLRRLLGDEAASNTALETAGMHLAERPEPLPPPPTGSQAEEIRLGDLRRTQGRVFVFTSQVLRWRLTFRPLLIVPVEGPVLDAETEEQYWRAVVCTPAESWPEEYFAEDEILIRSEAGHDYVAHLWLEYPVAAVQIGKDKAGEIAPASMECLHLARAAYSEGLPLGPEPRNETEACEEGSELVPGFRLDPSADTEALQAREQLHACADWLSATLDARLEYAVWQSSGWRPDADNAAQSEPSVPTEKAWELCGAGAGSGKAELTQCLEWAGPLSDFQALLSAPEAVHGCKSFTAECLLPPEPDDKDEQACRAQWSLIADSAHQAGRRFAVFYPAAERLLGAGTARAQGEGLPLLAELESGLWSDFEGVPLNQIILLFPESL